MKQQINISRFISIPFLTILAFSGMAQKSETTKPNLLFLITDQQIANSFTVYGNTHYDMPNLDDLASKSVVFFNTYVASPVCTPSRGSILTGTYPQNHGAVVNNTIMPEEKQTLPELLNTKSEYSTCYMGKWHLGDELFPQQGFHKWLSTEDGYNDSFLEGRDSMAKSDYYKFLKSKGLPVDDYSGSKLRQYASTLPIELSKTEFLKNKASEYLELNKANPFILYVSFLEPHTPFNGPYNDYYNADSLKLNDNFLSNLGENDPIRYQIHVQKGRSKEAWKKDNQRYAGLCHQVDEAIGGILKKLKGLGLDKNTIVVFTSDHGEMMGSHGLEHKGFMYQEAMRVPLLMRIPFENFKQNIVKTPVSNVDIVPTLLDLMGNSSEKYPHLDGQSLVSLINGELPERRYVFSVWNNNPDEEGKIQKKFENLTKEEILKYNRATFRTVVSSDGWKLSLSDVDKNQLFDLNNDKGELNNLYYSGKHKIKKKELINEILIWQKRTGDTLKLIVEN